MPYLAFRLALWGRYLALVAILLGLVLRLSNARMVFLGIGLPTEVGGSYVPSPSAPLVSTLGWLVPLLLAATLWVEALLHPTPVERLPARLWEGPRSLPGALLLTGAWFALSVWFWGRWVLN